MGKWFQIALRLHEAGNSDFTLFMSLRHMPNSILLYPFSLTSISEDRKELVFPNMTVKSHIWWLDSHLDGIYEISTNLVLNENTSELFAYYSADLIPWAVPLFEWSPSYFPFEVLFASYLISWAVKWEKG